MEMKGYTYRNGSGNELLVTWVAVKHAWFPWFLRFDWQHGGQLVLSLGMCIAPKEGPAPRGKGYLMFSARKDK